MILVIGGYFQGKRDYVKQKFNLSDSDFSDSVYSDAPVLIDFESFKGNLGEDELKLILNKKAVIAAEISCKVLSIDKEERQRAEKINEALQYLAQNADSVVRLYCGIPKALKGEI